VVGRAAPHWTALGAALFLAAAASAQPAGSIRGVVYDKDFDAPLAQAQVLIVETGQKVTATDQGNYVFFQVPPGKYTLVFSREGYARQVKGDVAVAPGRMTEVDAWLTGEFTEMEEFVVEDLEVGGASEAGLLRLRLESPALIDSVGSELLSLAGAGDAASALRLVSGATVQDGKYAVIRGLPDRYVSSQLNGFRLPTADAEKRAVQLDQFPAAVIDSIRVTKSFTPDQQGDASGGAVDVVLKGIPDQTSLQFKLQTSFNTQVTGQDDFLTYTGGGVNSLGFRGGGCEGTDYDGAVGVTRGEAPIDYKWSLSGGGKVDLDTGVRLGGFASLFYERDSAFFDNGIDNSLWVETPGGPMVPQRFQQSAPDDFKTQLFDVTQGTEVVQWGALGTVGLETENHKLDVVYLYSHIAEDQATLAEDTRGHAFFFPGYDPDDPGTPGHAPGERTTAPYLRLETLEYTERTSESLQIQGEHKLPFPETAGEGFKFLQSEIDWGYAHSTADLDQPDKVQFGSRWEPAREVFPGFIIPATHYPLPPAANFNLGNLQLICKEITEVSDQAHLDWTFPFSQWTGDEGYFQIGAFTDHVSRDYQQESFSNFGDAGASFEGEFNEFWSRNFYLPDHPLTAAEIDVDSRGDQDISAGYAMVDLPLVSSLSLIGGVRYESTGLTIVNSPEADVTWIPPGSSGPVQLNPGDADVFFGQEDWLPSIGLVYTPIDKLTLRGSWGQTVARQTFRELTPIVQQDFLGGPIFIGNPELQMSALQNLDLRLDYVPHDGDLVSVSWFYKSIDDPIEYVQRNAGFTYTTPVNYPEGELSGVEVELRADLGRYWDALAGLSVGANATWIDSEVTLPQDEIDGFNLPNIMAPMTTRDMTGAPNHLYNLYLTWDLEATGTQIGLFYTVTGDTLVAGAGQSNGHFVPSAYATQLDTLNFSITQKIGKHLKLTFQAKNLTNPEIKTVYRSAYIGGDVIRTSYTDGIEYSIGLSAEFTF
jgi:outer membrane receptor protein involved in Fe transport